MKGIKKGLAILLVLCTLLSMVVMTGAGTADTSQDTAAAQSANDFMRVFHLDCGRRYFTVAEIEGIIDELSANHYTHLQLAFGNEGLRFLLDDMAVTANGTTYSSSNVTKAIQSGNDSYDSSKSYSVSGDEELTETEMDAIISYANEKGIEIIPMLNVPGHTTALNTAMKTLDVTDVTGQNMNLGESEIAFTQALVQKYVMYFAENGSHYFHMGADEYENSGEYTTYVSYINGLAGIIQDANMTPIAFNDCIQTDQGIDTGIVISYWTDDNTTPAADLVQAGFQIMNTNNAWYYVLGDALYTEWSAGQWGYADSKSGLQKTSCTQVPGDSEGTVAPIGSTLSMWCDYPSYTYDSTEVYDLIATMASSNPTYFVASDSPDPTPDAGSVQVNVAIGETSAVYVQDGQQSIAVSGDDNIATANVQNEKQEGGYTATPVSSITNNSAYYIQISDGVYLTDNGGTTTDASQAAKWTFASTNNSGYRLQNGNNYLRYNNGLTTTTSSWQAATFYFNNGTVYRTSRGGSYSNPIGSTVDITQNAAIDQTNITFTGVALGETSYVIGDTRYDITVTKATATKSVAVGKSIELPVTGTPVIRGADNIADVTVGDNTVTITGLAAGSFTVEDDTTIYTVQVTKLDLGDVIEIPITIVDYRADGLLFDWSYWQNTSYAYSLVHVYQGNGSNNTNQTYGETLDGSQYGTKIAGTTLERTGIATTEKPYYPWGDSYYLDNSWSRMGLVQENLGANGMPVYTDATVQYVAGLLNAGYHNAVEGSCNSLIYDTFVASNASRYIRNTSTTQMSAGFAASQTWANISNAYDLAWYLLNTFYQADTNMTDVTGTDGQTHSVPIYGMAVDAYDTLYLKGSNGVYTFDAANNDVKYDTDNGAIYEDSNTTSAAFYPLEGLGYEQDGLLKKTSAIDNSRNGNFTLRGEAQFVYNEADNLYFTFKGDDDVYMYINGVLALDLGGAHGSNTKTVNLNELDADKYNLVDGQIATFTFFYMERCSDASTFAIATNMKLAQRNMTVEKKAYVNGVEIADGSAVANGASITYDLTVTNTGNASITGLTFTDADNCGTVIGSKETYLTDEAVTNGSVTTQAGSYQYYIGNGAKTTCENYNALVEAVKAVQLQPGETLHIVFLQTTLNAVVSSTDLKTLNYTNTMTIKDSSGLSLSDSHSVYTFDFGDTTNRYVVDFGLPVKTDNLFASGVTVTSVSLDKNPVYGTAVLNEDNTVTYTPNEVLRGIDVVTLKVQYFISGITFHTQKTIDFIPATTVYYEESFADFDIAKPTMTQAAEVAGQHANNYGYDPAYDTDAVGDSNGTIAALLDGAEGTFTFTGTGVDIYARCTTGTGKVVVAVYKQNEDNTETFTNFLQVNTVMKDGTTAATTNQEVTAYNVPIVSLTGLAYGNYRVVLQEVQTRDESNAKVHWPVYIDGFRVHGTLDVVNTTAYQADGEANPTFVELRNAVLAGLDVADIKEGQYADQIAENAMSQVYAEDETGKGAVVFTKGSTNSTVDDYDVQDLLDNGPKNEFYLFPGQTVVFKISDGYMNPQIGLKALNGEVKYTINNESRTLTTSTDMFYSIDSGMITITNNGAGILSITEIKAFAGVANGQAMFAALSEADLMPALLSMGFESEPVEATATLNITVQAGGETLTTTLTATGTEGESHTFTAAEIQAAVEVLELPEGYTLDGVTFEDVTVTCGEASDASFTAAEIPAPTPVSPLQKIVQIAVKIIKKIVSWF